ncbi:uncharacterized protein FA14DRAFT_189069 [Meira miltonrushii]|uniref:Wax synthase domain-containing protein n=1 Tax=Meira miltonrushii TaxID=1280837 RepID=A0A316VBQ4_9BASI|nr:uncharacterized protein FA14DRAFT_189069 [Meira miltonrushii]PWN35059.1 hypothetical protein FA14DRAFT_189069 [Meira miltonrushii]
MEEIIVNVWQMVLPPLENRIGIAFALLKTISVFTTLLLAVYVRIKHPKLSFHWKVLLAIIGISFTIYISFGIYLRFPWQKDGEDESLKWFMIFDAMSGGSAVHLPALILDYLFLATEEDLDVRGADEYRKYQADKHLKKETSNENLLERPDYFPGTSNPCIKELAVSPRGLGFHKGLNQKGIVQYEGGYAALIAVEKLESSQLEVAQVIKKDILFKILKVFLMCFLAGDFLAWVFSGYLARGDLLLKPTIATYYVVALVGCSVVARLQALYALFYLLALLYTEPTRIPITVSRWEPLLFAQPHLSTSMQQMWGKHWHSIIRRPMTVLFMRPAKQFCEHLNVPTKIGRAIGIILSFLFSGLMHEAILETSLPHIAHLKQLPYGESTLRTMGYGWGAKKYATTRFFVNCGLVILLEDIWCSYIEPKLAKVFTSKSKEQLIIGKARNVLGWLWCMSWMVVFAVELVDVWHQHGLLQGIIAPILFRFIPSLPLFGQTFI